MKLSTKKFRSQALGYALFLFCIPTMAEVVQGSSPTPTPSFLAPTPTPAQATSSKPVSEVIPATPDSDREEEAERQRVRFYRKRNQPPNETAKIYNGYFGIEGGLVQASGTYYNFNSTPGYGITAGLDTPLLGFGITAQRETFTIAETTIRQTVTQLMLELNFFSYLLLNGGVHVGDVIHQNGNFSASYVGLGVHVGFDLHISDKITAGLGAYGTYVFQTGDRHTLFHLMIPIKYWF